MNLNNKKCVPCEGGVKPISSDEIGKYLKNVAGWQLKEGGKEIEKEFKFRNFVQAIEFVNKVGDIAEKEGHHPDIEFGWGYCRIRLSTHSIGGIHENDFIVASKIDGIKNV